MKKSAAVFLALLLMLMFAACAKNPSENTTETGEADTAFTAPEPPSMPDIDTEKILSGAPEVYGSALYVKINPEFVLYVSDDGSFEVTGYEALNDDAKAIENRCALTGRSVYDAVTDIVHASADDGYLKAGGEVALHIIAGSDEYEINEILNRAEKAVSDEAKAQGIAVNPSMTIAPSVEEAVKQAEENGTQTEEINSMPENGSADEPENSLSDVPPEDDTCGDCQGTGKCRFCDGTGRVGCRCGGTGTESCGQCGGTGSHKCSVCGMSGKERCPICGGDGIDEQDDGKVCERCAGTGIAVCAGCGGTGYAFCGQCSGTGTCTCGECGGLGYLVCGETDNTSCDGCGGTGACSYCGGTGKRTVN